MKVDDAQGHQFPWANLLLFAIALVPLFFGLRRAFKPDQRIVSKIFGSLAAVVGLLLLAGLLFLIYVMGSWLPASSAAPQVGQKAPVFTLIDSNDKPVTLAQLLTEPINNKPPKGVLLIFTAAIGEGIVTSSCEVSKRI